MKKIQLFMLFMLFMPYVTIKTSDNITIDLELELQQIERLEHNKKKQDFIVKNIKTSILSNADILSSAVLERNASYRYYFTWLGCTLCQCPTKVNKLEKNIALLTKETKDLMDLYKEINSMQR